MTRHTSLQMCGILMLHFKLFGIPFSTKIMLCLFRNINISCIHEGKKHNQSTEMIHGNIMMCIEFLRNVLALVLTQTIHLHLSGVTLDTHRLFSCTGSILTNILITYICRYMCDITLGHQLDYNTS